MEQTLERIIGKINDYKTCQNCFCINWYENDNCHNCEKTKFKDMRQKEADQIQNDIDDKSIEYYDNETFMDI